ncbi:hypothetical protein RZS08_36030, partial [Arthrospira platensis SPKY1]|nr:hypothetical protein [Arthrospira platensis SPKY1]
MIARQDDGATLWDALPVIDVDAAKIHAQGKADENFQYAVQHGIGLQVKKCGDLSPAPTQVFLRFAGYLA